MFRRRLFEPKGFEGTRSLGMRRSFLILGIGLVMAAAAAVLALGDLFGRAYGPRGKLMVRTPTFMWQVWSTEPGEIVGGSASLDSVAMDARYDVGQRRVLADLKSPLGPGKHNVTVSAVLKDGQTISKSWEVEVPEAAIERLPPTSESQLKVLAEVNRFRAALGLPACQMDDALNAASLQHAKYLVRNNTTGHFQAVETPGFFGRDPVERLEAFGFIEDSWEVVEFGAVTESEAIENLIDAPYHRLPFMQPGTLRFGSGFDTQRLTATFSMSRIEGTVCHPWEGQKDVKTTWSKNERPNPLRLHEGVRYPLGYPIVFSYFSSVGARLKFRVAKLSDQDGQDVPIYINSPENDSELKSAVFLIPKSPLRPSTTYFARVDAGIENGPDVSRIWRFTTAAR